jgi:glycosyltransferase involved in cell wall biosynthesis
MVVSLSRELVRRGCEVVVGHRGNKWLEDELRGEGIAQRIFDFSPDYASHATWPRFAWRLSRYIRANKFDIVHAHLFGMIVLGACAAALARTPILGTIHDVYYIQEKRKRAYAYRFAASIGCKLAVVSRDAQSVVSRLTGIDERRIGVIHNGADVDGLQRKGAVSNGRPTVLSVGRLSAEKNFETLIRASEKVTKRIPNSRFLIAGSGPLRDELKRFAADLRVDSRVEFLGQVADVPRLLQEADVFALSSLTEGLSMSVLEALAAGKPSVVTDVGGNKELVIDGHNGFLVPPNDPGALAEKICVLLEEKGLAREFGLNARARAVNSFSLMKMADGYQNAYREQIKKVRSVI